jgi:hypothetical protein
MNERAGDQAEQLFDAACAYALCAAAAKQAKTPAVPSIEKLANEAMLLLKQAAARGYKDAAHMKLDRDLVVLRQRADFQKLLAELEAVKK